MADGPRLAIVGSRALEGYVGLREEVQLIIGAYQPSKVVTGYNTTTGSPLGVDKMAYQVATEWGIPVALFPVEPAQAGKVAFAIAAYDRNQKIVDACDAVVAIMVPGGSRGTMDTVKKAHRAGKRVQILYLAPDGSGTLVEG